MRMIGAVLVAVVSQVLCAQALAPLPGCEPRTEVRQVLDEKLSGPILAKMKFKERVSYRRQLLEEMIRRFPREVEPYRRLINDTRQDDEDGYPALVDRFQKQAELRPQDPLALYLAGLALRGTNTELGIQLFERARLEAKNFAWPALELARIYAPATLRADKKKTAAEMSDFFAACPASDDPVAQRLLRVAGTRELQMKVAASMRARLSGERDQRRVLEFADLWALEFASHAPADYGALRTHVAADVKRLEAANPKPDAEFLVFLAKGYKQSGASPEAVAAAEDRVIQAFPHSDEAWQIVSDRWDQAHKPPEDEGDAVAWNKYHSEYRAALKDWMARFTDAPELQHKELYRAALFDADMPDAVAKRAVDDYLSYIEEYEQPSINDLLIVAGFLEDHNWEPKRAFELLRDSDKQIERWYRRMSSDNQNAEAQEIWDFNKLNYGQLAAARLLVAARLAEQPGEAERIKPFVEGPLPSRKVEVLYWWNRARLAALEGRKADALTYYQKALQARKQAPKPVEGRVLDPLSDDARKLWNQLGGTETAWALWSQQPTAKATELAESGWHKPDKTMPAFELVDLSGKTWRLKELGGRAVLINVWATWCGPCVRELPQLEKLYQQVKDRKDLQILTFAVDEDPGVLPAFLKEKGYTFPVLPANSFTHTELDLFYVPQNWIIDAKGEWRWSGAPSGPDEKWGAAMLKQLEAAR